MNQLYYTYVSSSVRSTKDSSISCDECPFSTCTSVICVALEHRVRIYTTTFDSKDLDSRAA